VSRWSCILMTLAAVIGLLVGPSTSQERDGRAKSPDRKGQARGAAKVSDAKEGVVDKLSGKGKAPAKEGQAEKKFRPRSPAGPLPAFTADNEAAALRFVGQHHGELSSLLQYLKTSSPEEYKRAVRELFRTSEKLAQTKSMDEERYQIELESWKIDSEIRLLAAKLTMGDSDDLRAKLRQQVARKNKMQIERLELEKRRAEQRIKKMDESIARLKKEQDQMIDRQMAELLRTVRKERPTKRTRPAASDVSAANASAGDGRRASDRRVEKAEPVTSDSEK